MPRTILLFPKDPETGRMKTHLVATMALEEGAEVYREAAAEFCLRLPNAGEREIVLVDPPEHQSEVEQRGRSLMSTRSHRFIPPSRGDFGNRLEQAFAAFAVNFEQVSEMGGDGSELMPGIFEETGRELDKNDVCLSTTDNGASCLLALRKTCPALFYNISWSTGAVFAQTLARAEPADLRVSLLPELTDVDTEDNWRRAEARLKA